MPGRRNGIIDAAFGIARIFRSMNRNRRAQRVMNALPDHLRKDIGWPDNSGFSDDRFR